MIEQIITFFQIILIDLVLAGDNAIIIGMVASQFNPELRKKIIFCGIGLATITSKWIKEYVWIGWLGLFAILAVALDLIYNGAKTFL